jgi:hypothetical protein
VPGGAAFTLTAIGSTTGCYIGNNGKVLWYGDWNDPDTDIDTGLFVDQSLLIQEGVSMVNGDVIDTIAATDQTFAMSDSGRYVIVELFSINSADPTLNGAYIYDLNTTLGTPFCSPANANSTGNPAVISATGSDVVADNDLTLRATSLPPNAFAYFIASRTQGLPTMPPGSQGIICLAGSVGRAVGGSVLNSGAAGVVSTAADLNAMPQPLGPVMVMQGESWSFQCWFRDVGMPATSNFTDGLEITFQ